jgi:hypothetical protein
MSLSQYQTILDMPHDAWVRADAEDWSIRECVAVVKPPSPPPSAPNVNRDLHSDRPAPPLETGRESAWDGSGADDTPNVERVQHFDEPPALPEPAEGFDWDDPQPGRVPDKLPSTPDSIAEIEGMDETLNVLRRLAAVYPESETLPLLAAVQGMTEYASVDYETATVTVNRVEALLIQVNAEFRRLMELLTDFDVEEE